MLYVSFDLICEKAVFLQAHHNGARANQEQTTATRMTTRRKFISNRNTSNSHIIKHRLKVDMEVVAMVLGMIKAMLLAQLPSPAASDHLSSRQGKILRRREKMLRTRMLAVVMKKLSKKPKKSTKKSLRKPMIRA